MQNIAPMIESYLINKVLDVALFGEKLEFVNSRQLYRHMLSFYNLRQRPTSCLILLHCCVMMFLRHLLTLRNMPLDC